MNRTKFYNSTVYAIDRSMGMGWGEINQCLDSYAFDDASNCAYHILWDADKLNFGSDVCEFTNKSELQLLYCFLLAMCESGDLDMYFDEDELGYAKFSASDCVG